MPGSTEEFDVMMLIFKQIWSRRTITINGYKVQHASVQVCKAQTLHLWCKYFDMPKLLYLLYWYSFLRYLKRSDWMTFTSSIKLPRYWSCPDIFSLKRCRIIWDNILSSRNEILVTLSNYLMITASCYDWVVVSVSTSRNYSLCFVVYSYVN